MKTAEQIVIIASKKTENHTGKRVIINRLFREQDDSKLWPISGKFNVTERAIRHARKFERDSDVMSSYEYALFIEAETSRIVNDPKHL